MRLYSKNARRILPLKYLYELLSRQEQNVGNLGRRSKEHKGPARRKQVQEQKSNGDRRELACDCKVRGAQDPLDVSSKPELPHGDGVPRIPLRCRASQGNTR